MVHTHKIEKVINIAHVSVDRKSWNPKPQPGFEHDTFRF